MAQKTLYIEFVFNKQEPHEGIVVHWPRLVIGESWREIGPVQSTLLQGQDEHFVMKATDICHVCPICSKMCLAHVLVGARRGGETMPGKSPSLSHRIVGSCMYTWPVLPMAGR
jgi:NAD-dependent dihydropyrimidine dehydrogenase PreA subunit